MAISGLALHAGLLGPKSASGSAHGSTRRRALRAASGGDGDGDFRAMLRRYAVTSPSLLPTHSGDFGVTVTTSQFLVA